MLHPHHHLLLLLPLLSQRTVDMRVTADLSDIDEQRPGWTEQQAAEAAAEAAQAGLHELDSPRSSEAGASLTAATVDGESEAGSPSRIPSMAAAGSSSGAAA